MTAAHGFHLDLTPGTTTKPAWPKPAGRAKFGAARALRPDGGALAGARYSFGRPAPAIFPPRRPAEPPEEPRMRIALLYPPPWKIPGPGEPAYPADGPPSEYREGDLDPDFYQTPYGLFTLGAEALRAGHQVKVINLSAYAWPEVTRVVRELEADLYGMSCWTANRRGVALTAREIKKHH